MYFIRYFMDKEVRDNIIRILDEGYKAIQDDDALKLRMISFDLSVKEFFSLVDRVAGKLKFYIKEVIDTAKISKGSRLYEHGVSLSKTADLLGVSAYELMSYIGKTGIADVDAPLKNTVRKRLSFTRGLFV